MLSASFVCEKFNLTLGLYFCSRTLELVLAEIKLVTCQLHKSLCDHLTTLLSFFFNCRCPLLVRSSKMFLLFKAVALIWLHAADCGAMRVFVLFDVTS